jgi:hypothetical protein
MALAYGVERQSPGQLPNGERMTVKIAPRLLPS